MILVIVFRPWSGGGCGTRCPGPRSVGESAWCCDRDRGGPSGRARMGVGLQPLEFTECLADSPQFRDNLQRHEKELERTSQQIKRLIKEVKDVVQAARRECSLVSSPLLMPGTGSPQSFHCRVLSVSEQQQGQWLCCLWHGLIPFYLFLRYLRMTLLINLDLVTLLDK